MRVRIIIFLLILSVAFRADAQAVPAFNGAVNKMLGKVIENNAIRRGFAANDPRMLATYSGASTVAASIAADVAVTAATAASAPVWLSLAAGLGAAAVVGGLAYGAYKLFFDDSSSKAGFYVKKPGTGTTGQTPPATPSIVPNSYTNTISTYDAPVGSTLNPGTTVYSPPKFPLDAKGVPISATQEYYILPSYFSGLWLTCNVTSECMQIAIDYYKKAGAIINPDAGLKCNPVIYNTADGGYPTHQSCSFQYKMNPDGSWMVASGTMDFTRNPYYAGTPPQDVKGSVSDILSQMDPVELAKPADPETIAKLADGLWQKAAAQPGYNGLPYSVTDPVTAADAKAVQAANPASWPKNSDLVSPVAPAAGKPVVVNPAFDPAANPNTGDNTNTSPSSGLQNVNVMNTPNVNIANKVQIEWGTDPAVASPSLEAIPTGQAILSPVLKLMPTLRNFVVPSHTSECPKPTFNIFNKSIVMDSHCTLLDGVRSTLYAVMAFVWLMLAALIVLRA